MSAPHKKRLTRKRRPFQGDVDVIELRRRLSIEPNHIPEPLLREPQPFRVPRVAKFALSVGVLSIIFWGVIEATHSNGVYPVYPSPNNAIASITTPANAIPPTSTTKLVTTGNGARPVTPVLLGVQDRRDMMNEPLALGAVFF